MPLTLLSCLKAQAQQGGQRCPAHPLLQGRCLELSGSCPSCRARRGRVAPQCPDSACKQDLLAYLQRIALYCHQLNICSKVKAEVQNLGGELVVSGVRMAHACSGSFAPPGKGHSTLSFCVKHLRIEAGDAGAFRVLMDAEFVLLPHCSGEKRLL